MRVLLPAPAFLLLGLASALPPASAADMLVVPTGANYENVDAPSSSPFPFATSLPFANYPFRYQQVYDASYFTSFGDVLQIEELHFRIDQSEGDRGAFTVNDVDVYLSTTAAQPDALASGSSLALDGNVGQDSTLVYSGPLAWDPCGASTCVQPPFDQTVPFDFVYEYDPAAGNLLLEVLYPTSPYPEQRFDAVNVGDEMSNAREVIDRDDGVTHIFPVADSLGLVTQFVFTVPEPETPALAIAALAGVAALRRVRA